MQDEDGGGSATSRPPVKRIGQDLAPSLELLNLCLLLLYPAFQQTLQLGQLIAGKCCEVLLQVGDVAELARGVGKKGLRRTDCYQLLEI